jgi:hypothetical protein
MGDPYDRSRMTRQCEWPPLPRHIDAVRAVAAGLGIMHMRRFAAAYRDALGETPSQTLNRAA